MPSFEELFRSSKGGPISYQGKTLVMVDHFPIEEHGLIRIEFESCNGQWRQGVGLKCDGKFALNGRKFSGKNGVVIWYDSAPRIVDIIVLGTETPIQVKNVWDTGNGSIDSWHNGAAMIIESCKNGRRYLCNDGFADNDFDDIVFSIVNREADEGLAE